MTLVRPVAGIIFIFLIMPAYGHVPDQSRCKRVLAITVFPRPVYQISFWKGAESSFQQYRKVGDQVIRNLPMPITVEYLQNEDAGREIKEFETPHGGKFIQETVLPGDRIRIRISQTATSRDLVLNENPFLASLIDAAVEKSKPQLLKITGLTSTQDFTADELDFIRVFQGEALALGVQIDGVELRSTPTHSMEKSDESQSTLTANFAKIDDTLITQAQETLIERGEDPLTYDGPLYFAAVHTHPGTGAPLNSTDVDTAVEMFRWARRAFPKAKIQVDIVASPTETFGDLVYIYSVGSLNQPYTMEYVGPAQP